MPDSPPMYSPMIAPSIAAGAAMRSAANRLGSAARMRTFASSCDRARRRSAWTTSSIAGSALRSPTSMPTSVVKNTDSAARMILGVAAVEDDLQDRADGDDRQAVRHDAELHRRLLEQRDDEHEEREPDGEELPQRQPHAASDSVTLMFDQ